MATSNQTSTGRLIHTANTYMDALNVLPLIVALCGLIGRTVRYVATWVESQRDYSRYCAQSARTIEARTQAAQNVSPALDAPRAVPVTHDDSGIPYAWVAHEECHADCAVLTERDLVPVMSSGILRGALASMTAREEGKVVATIPTPRKRTTTSKVKGEKVSVAANDATTERVFPAGLGVELGRAVKEVLAYEVSRLTYRELQTRAKSKGIRANQSAEALRAALTN
jgi:hypothetical protein